MQAMWSNPHQDRQDCLATGVRASYRDLRVDRFRRGQETSFGVLGLGPPQKPVSALLDDVGCLLYNCANQTLDLARGCVRARGTEHSTRVYTM